MKIGWLVDNPGYIGGAELTQDEFRRAAPDGVEVVSCPPGAVVPGLDRYVIHNCVRYSLDDLGPTEGAPLVRYIHDIWPHGDASLRDYLLRAATLIFCSPLHRDRFPHPVERDSHLIPPAIDLKSFQPTRQQRRNTKREGACCVGAFRHPNKGAQQLADWAARNGGIDVYGTGQVVPGEGVNFKGTLSPAEVAQTLWAYETFVYLPTTLEPFGRCVAEAWASKCQIVTNQLVGARYWIEQEQEKLETAATDFWKVVLN